MCQRNFAGVSMSQPRIGEVLCQMGNLTRIDVDEILVEQAVNLKKFGEIAMDWGLCTPEQICDAWCNQVKNTRQPLDLDTLGVDPYATTFLPVELAEQYEVIPLRSVGDQIVMASCREVDSSEIAELSFATGKTVRFLPASREQIQRAIKTLYIAAGAVAA
jgi:type IV pilus assembly protein PilB